MTTDTQEITRDFSEGFFDGAGSTTVQEAKGFPVSIDGRGFIIAWDAQYPFMRRSVNLLNTQQAQSGGDQAQTPPEVWRRSSESFHFGAGQSSLDRPDSAPYRYRDSAGVDPWTPWQLTLLHDTSMAQAVVAGTSSMHTLTGFVVTVAANKGYWYNTATQAWTETTFAASVVSATSDGEALFVLETDGKVYRYTTSASSTTFVGTAIASFSSTRSFIAAVKGQLIVGNKNLLYDVTSGTATQIGAPAHPNPSFTWTTACDGSSFVYLLGGIGDKWHVYSMPLAVDGTFDPPGLAASLPEGEIATAIATYLGYVLIGSNKGFRLAASDGFGAITYGQLAATDCAVDSFEGQDRYVWYGCSKASGNSGLGRADLATFVSPLTPATAPDLAGSGGAGRVGGVATFNGTTGTGQRMFSLDGVGIYLESATAYVAEGWIELGASTFGTTDQKQGLYAQAFYDIPGGSLELQYSKDGGTFETIGSGIAGSTMGNVPVETTFSTLELRINLLSSTDQSDSPILKRAEARAVPVPGRTSEWSIPLVIADRVEWEGGATNRRIADDIDLLTGLAEGRRRFIFREGGRTWELYATDYQWMPAYESEGMRAYAGTLILIARQTT